MIKHIVMWNFADRAEGADKAANLGRAQAELLALRRVVPGMGAFEPVIGADPYEHSYDLILYSEFEDLDALRAYAEHPDHLEVVAFIGKVRTERVCMDYEV